MPTIPRLPGRQVRKNPLPDTRRRSSLPQEAFGGGQGASDAFSAAGRLADTATAFSVRDVGERRAYEEEQRRRFLQMASAEFVAKLSAEETRLKGELQKSRGKDALQASSDTLKAFDQFYRDNTKNLADPDLAERYRAHFLQYRDSVNSFAAPYADREMRNYDNETTRAIIENEGIAGIQSWEDPKRVAAALERQRAAISAFSAREGKPPEERDRLILEAHNKIHEGVISRFMSAGRVGDAKAYYDAHKNEIVDPAPVERAIQEQDSLRAAQFMVDEIMQGAGPVIGKPPTAPAATLKEALERVDKLSRDKEPKFREMARTLLKSRWSDREAAQEQAEEASYESITKAYDADPSVDPRTIDPVAWQRLPTKYRDAIQRRYAKEQKNDGLFLEFMVKPLDEIAAYSPARFEAEVWSRLPEKQREQARTRFTQAKDAQEKPEKRAAFNGVISRDERIFRALRSIKDLGFKADDTPHELAKDTSRTGIEKLATWNQFRDSVESVMLAYTRQHNKNPDDDETQKIIDKLLLTKVFSEGKEMPYAAVPAEKRQAVLVPYVNIPETQRAFIENRIRSKDKRVTQSKVERIYLATMLNDDPLADRIMDE